MNPINTWCKRLVLVFLGILLLLAAGCGPV